MVDFALAQSTILVTGRGRARSAEVGKPMRSRTFLLAIAMSLAACSQPDEALKKEVSALRADLITAQSQIADIESKQQLITFGEVAVLDLEDKAYSRLKTEMGVMLISVERVEPHLDGVRVTLRVGNPHNVILQGFKAKVRWGGRLPLPNDDQFDAKMTTWKSAVQEKEISSSSSIFAGSWNLVQITVAPAKQEEFGYLAISGMDFDTLRLQ